MLLINRPTNKEAPPHSKPKIQKNKSRLYVHPNLLLSNTKQNNSITIIISSIINNIISDNTHSIKA